MHMCCSLEHQTLYNPTLSLSLSLSPSFPLSPSLSPSSQVKGTVNDSHGVPQYLMRGYWDEKMTCKDSGKKGEGCCHRNTKRAVEGETSTVSQEDGSSLPPSFPFPPLLSFFSLYKPGCELMYGFTEFVCSLNEMEEGVHQQILI